jgi:uncharacterized protein (UPF0276 family)
MTLAELEVLLERRMEKGIKRVSMQVKDIQDVIELIRACRLLIENEDSYLYVKPLKKALKAIEKWG